MKQIQIDKQGLIGKQVRVFAPGTVANLICGFDVLGMAIEQPGDEVLMRIVETPGVRLLRIEGDGGILPKAEDKNTVSASVIRFLEMLGLSDLGVEIELYKQMPIGSGMGSSSASTVAGLVAINALLEEPLSKKELLPLAMEGEALACGHGHADNVAPALLGGITLIRSYAPLDIVSLPVPDDLWISVIFPDVEVPTRGARDMIKKKIELGQAVKQWGNVAGLISGLFLSDYDLIGRSMKDELIEPVRSILIPEFDGMRQIALENGALCLGISGSGPSVFALSTSAEKARSVNERIIQHMQEQSIPCLQYLSKVNVQGARVLACEQLEVNTLSN